MIKQTSSNHLSNIQQMYSKYTHTTCALTARCLLDVCLMIDWLCKRGIIHRDAFLWIVLYTTLEGWRRVYCTFCARAVADADPVNALYVSPPWPGAGRWLNYTVQLEVVAFDLLPRYNLSLPTSRPRFTRSVSARFFNKWPREREKVYLPKQ